MNTVAQLTNIWSRILRTQDVGPDSDFFELGGDSLTAVGLFLEIERALDRRFPITTIYDAPTVVSLARFIDEEAQPEYCHFVPLKAGDQRAPLFLVHGIGGAVMELGPLGKLIRSDKAIYGIQARGLDGSEPPLDRVEDMADLYAGLIRAKQPHGPYFLGGYSFGGVIALEIARRLGPENVAQLLLLDSFAHPRTWPFQCRAQVGLRKLARRLRETAKRPIRETALSLVRKVGARLTPLTPERAAAERAAHVNNWIGAVDPNLPLPLRETRIAGDAALIAFVPMPYPGAATFLRARHTGSVFPTDALSVWRDLVGGLAIQTIEGSHVSIIAEHAPELAARISACLAPSMVRDRNVSPAPQLRLRHAELA